MTIITNEHELAADTHIDTADEHDGARDHAPEHQVEQRLLRMVVNYNVQIIVRVVVTVKDCTGGIVSPIPAIPSATNG